MAPFLTAIEKIYLAGSDTSRRAYVFVATAERPLQSRLGTVFGLVELNDLPEPLSEKIFEIVRDLEIEYYLPPFDINEPHERRFEDCLQRANRRLGRTIQDSIERVNVERITALVGLISQNKLHLSTIGPAGAFLFHRRRRYDQVIIDIIDQGSDKQTKINPEKLFSNIISGAISERDQVVCCNDTVLEYVAQSEISSIIEDKVPLVAAQALEERLTDLDGTFVGLIIAPQVRETNAAPVEPVPSTLQPQHSINRLLTTQAKTEAYLTPSLMPSWKKVLVLSGTYLKTGVNGLTGSLSSLAARMQQSRASHAHRPDTQLPPPVRERAFEHHAPAPVEPELELVIEATPALPPEAAPLSAQNWDDLPVFEDEAEEQPTAHRPSPTVNELGAASGKRLAVVALGSAFTGAISGLKQAPRHPLISLSNALNRLIASYVRLARLQQIILAVAFGCLFVFSLSIVVAGQTGTSSAKNLEVQFRAVEDKLATAEAQNVFNDESGAQASLAAAQDLFNHIPDKRSVRDRRQALEKRLSDLRQTFLKITKIDNPKIVTELAKTNNNAQAATLAVANDTLYSFDSNNQSLYRINPTTGDVNGTKLDATDIRQLNADGSTLYLLSGARQVLRFVNNTATPVLTSDADLTTIGGYGGKLYTLRGADGTIFKHQLTGNAFNSGASWLRDTHDIKGATSIAIDGGIYVGRGSELVYFISGKIQPSSFTPLDPAIDTAQIAASIDSNYIYVLDRTNKRIVAYDKKGALKMQFVSPAWNDLKAIAVNDKEKTIYVLADQKVYSVSIPF